MPEIICPSCGAACPEGSKFCEACGRPLTAEPSAPTPEATPEVAPAPQPKPEAKPDRKNAPASFWAFLGLIILFNLPSLGFIASVIFSFAPENKSIKNFARAWMTLKIVVFVLVLILAVVLFAILGSFIASFGSIFHGDSFDSLITKALDNEYFAKVIDDTVGEMSVDDIIDLIGEESVNEILAKANEAMNTDVTFDELLQTVREMTDKDSPTVNEILEYYGDDMGEETKSLSEFLRTILTNPDDAGLVPYPRSAPSSEG